MMTLGIGDETMGKTVNKDEYKNLVGNPNNNFSNRQLAE